MHFQLVVFFTVFYDLGEFQVIEISVIVNICMMKHFIAFVLCKPEM